MNSKVSLGRAAEQRAADYLLNLGYTIITRNYQIRGGEIDIIALDEDELVFVEVRWRTDDLAEESIGTKKAESIRRTMQTYLTAMDETRGYRCDLITASPIECRHHKDFLRS
ncbi:MAG: YraN family protein [Armatimonadota bacterium]